MFRRSAGGLEVLLVHPGGPFWAKKDLGAWTIPKGELEDGEDELATAQREFEEETGIASGGSLPSARPHQAEGRARSSTPGPSRGIATAADDPEQHVPRASGRPGSGQWQEVPEVDRAEWFDSDEARRRINPAQAALRGRAGEDDQRMTADLATA